MCPSIGGNVGETWLRRGPIITPPLRVGCNLSPVTLPPLYTAAGGLVIDREKITILISQQADAMKSSIRENTQPLNVSS